MVVLPEQGSLTRVLVGVNLARGAPQRAAGER
jgi:hypothetical protein